MTLVQYLILSIDRQAITQIGTGVKIEARKILKTFFLFPLYSYKCNHLCYFYLINCAKVIKAINRYSFIQSKASSER
jgi:hypothetical protein